MTVEHDTEKDAALIALAQRILAPGDDDNVTLGELRREYGISVLPPGERMGT